MSELKVAESAAFPGEAKMWCTGLPGWWEGAVLGHSAAMALRVPISS